jgi:aspartate kinase
MDEKKLINILKVLDQKAVKINMMQNSALTFSIVFDEDEEKLSNIINSLDKLVTLAYNHKLSLATIKNYNDEALVKLNIAKGVILEQKSRSVYQVLFSSDIPADSVFNAG